MSEPELPTGFFLHNGRKAAGPRKNSVALRYGDHGNIARVSRSSALLRALQDTRLPLRLSEIALLDGFRQSGKLQMSVRVARSVQCVLKPRASGNSVRIRPIRFHLHDVPVHALRQPHIERAFGQRTLDRGVEFERTRTIFPLTLMPWRRSTS